MKTLTQKYKALTDRQDYIYQELGNMLDWDNEVATDYINELHELRDKVEKVELKIINKELKHEHI